MNTGSRFETRRTALVLVDIQNDFCHPEGSVGKRGYSVASIAAMMPGVHRLLSAARAFGVKVVFIQSEHSEATDSPAWLARPTMRRAAAKGLGGNVPVLKGTWGAEFFEIAPHAGEDIVTKYRYSAFLHTELELLLRTAGIEQLVFVGTQTNVCVNATATDALMRDFHVVLATDATATVDDAAYQAAVRQFGDHLGDCATSEDLAQEWSTSVNETDPVPVSL